MLVIWMAYTNKVNVDEDRYITNEQYLLENAIYEMDNLRDGYIDDFVECVCIHAVGVKRLIMKNSEDCK